MSIFKELYRFFSPKFQNAFLDYKIEPKPRYGWGSKPHKELYAIVNTRREAYENILKNSEKYWPNLLTINDHKEEDDIFKPTWNNGFLPGLDILSIYTILAEARPSKYFEIGSGNSTKVAHKVITEQNIQTQILSIDPVPRAEIDELASHIIREPVENIDMDIFLELEKNDVLFVDNSHRLLPNSDSMVFYLEILPRLKKGVIVQIHDIYLPYDYPQFMCDRLYSEQYGLAMYLLANSHRFDIILPNYFISEDQELSNILLPFWSQPHLANVEPHGGSFWFRV